MSENINEKIVSYLMKYDPQKVGIFGSYARGEETESSDIDILVNFNKKVTLFDLGEIKVDLTKQLNREVDVVTERALNPKLKPFIYSDLIIIYAKRG